uniref:Uncharacterized protein n=1 Tax=Panagrolaimus superbus TaxID=310955 RepID=A0A914YX64_9BILA
MRHQRQHQDMASPCLRQAEMNGYLVAMSDNRLKSLKRRYVVLKNSEMKFYRTQKHLVRDENPTMTIKLRDVKNISKVSSKSGGNGFENIEINPFLFFTIFLNGESHKLQAEADKITDEWYNTISQQLKTLTITDFAQRLFPFDPQISGWVTKVKNGHQKRYFTQIIDDKLLFFKKPDEKIPHSHQNLRGARISEKCKSSSDEYSSSSGDEQNEIGAIRGSANCSSSASAIYNGCSDSDYSICIEAVDSDPQYLILRTSEDKDRWLYYLRLAARDASIRGTPFEILIERLMAESNPLDSLLWHDLLFKTVEEHQTETITTIDNAEFKKKALEIDLACYLFTAVQMRPIAIQYHVDLSQNILTKALQHESLQNEIYAQLIRLTSGSMEYGYQAWKLLSMAIPLYLPKQYSLLWLLRHHIERTRKDGVESEARMAEYCNQALSNRQKVGDRLEGPSKLEAISILTRDPMNTVLPYSIAIRLPTGDHQVIEFDGSTEIGQCLSSLCLKLGIRPALLSGYALYANDPMGSSDDLILLKGKQKLCDCLTLWERQTKDSKTGRVTADACSIKLQLRIRNYWGSLSDDETATERLFLCQRLGEEVVAGHLPLSNDLAEELCALYAQMCYGDASEVMDEKLIDEILSRFYPTKLLEVANRRSLRLSVHQQWKNLLQSVNVTECVRLILIVLRKWKFFGSYVKEARQKIDDKKIFIAINENGVHLLSDQLESLKSFPFHRFISFGEYHGDFMITVSRILQPTSHPDESTRERLTFNMEKKAIEQITTHLAEYIRCQKLLWKISRK